MSKAMDEYYKFKAEADDHFEGLRDPIDNYVQELQQQNKELIEFLRLTKDLIEDFEYGVNQRSFIPDKIEELLRKHTEEARSA